jgi:hypothetical protein
MASSSGGSLQLRVQRLDGVDAQAQETIDENLTCFTVDIEGRPALYCGHGADMGTAVARYAFRPLRN